MNNKILSCLLSTFLLTCFADSEAVVNSQSTSTFIQETEACKTCAKGREKRRKRAKARAKRLGHTRKLVH